MGGQDFGTGKSLVVLAIVVGCFAVLWPKIFYPMMQTAFSITSPKVDTDSCKFFFRFTRYKNLNSLKVFITDSISLLII